MTSKYQNEEKPIAYVGDQSYVFISYSRKDKDIVYSDLFEMNKIGVRFWYDDGIAAGENWRLAVKEKIESEKCVGVIFYLSKNTIFSEPIDAEIKMVFGADALRKRNFAIVIDYDNLDFSLERIIDKECQKTKNQLALERAFLVKNIFTGDNNYLFRTPEKDDFTKHFYKMLLRISDFGALPLDAVLKLTPDYSDFTFKDHEDGLEISGYSGKEKTLYLPEQIYGKRILRIGNKCFKENKFLKNVVIPNSVKSIGFEAFCRCVNLAEVDFDVDGSDLETIEAHAFFDCFSLKKMILPKKLKTVEAQAFGECEFSNDTVGELYFLSANPPRFDIECVSGSKLYVPIEGQQAYIEATGLQNNVYSILDAPTNLEYNEGKVYWNSVYGASSYEVDEDYIPIAIVKENSYDYMPKEGLHTLTVKALGNFYRHILCSGNSSEIICGVTPLEELRLNKTGDEVLSYLGVNKTVVLPDCIKKITGSVLIFYNVTDLYIPETVYEIAIETIAGVKTVHINKNNPYFYVSDGKIFKADTNEYIRDEVLGDYYFLYGNKYDTLTHTKIE